MIDAAAVVSAALSSKSLLSHAPPV